jgi:hypothetical protein
VNLFKYRGNQVNMLTVAVSYFQVVRAKLNSSGRVVHTDGLKNTTERQVERVRKSLKTTNTGTHVLRFTAADHNNPMPVRAETQLQPQRGFNIRPAYVFRQAFQQGRIPEQLKLQPVFRYFGSADGCNRARYNRTTFGRISHRQHSKPDRALRLNFYILIICDKEFQALTVYPRAWKDATALKPLFDALHSQDT